LFVGDAICSVSIIDVVEAEGGEVRLESVAKDFSPLWPVTVESLDQDTIIGANVSYFFFGPTTTNTSTPASLSE